MHAPDATRVTKSAFAHVFVLSTWYACAVLIARHWETQTVRMEMLILLTTFLGMFVQAIVIFLTALPLTPTYTPVRRVEGTELSNQSHTEAAAVLVL